MSNKDFQRAHEMYYDEERVRGPERDVETWGEPAPTQGHGPSMHDLVIADLASRKEFGLAKYGTELRAWNGRNGLKDAYEEVLDLAVYLRQRLAEDELAQAAIDKVKEMQEDA